MPWKGESNLAHCKEVNSLHTRKQTQQRIKRQRSWWWWWLKLVLVKVDTHCNTRVIHIVKRSCQSKRREWLHCHRLNRVGCIGRISQMALLIEHICFVCFKRVQMQGEIWEEEILVHIYILCLIRFRIHILHACVNDWLVCIWSLCCVMCIQNAYAACALCK